MDASCDRKPVCSELEGNAGKRRQVSWPTWTFVQYLLCQPRDPRLTECHRSNEPRIPLENDSPTAQRFLLTPPMLVEDAMKKRDRGKYPAASVQGTFLAS